jgi:hypothetical protein
MVKSKKGVSIANDFHIAIPGQLSDGAVDVFFVSGSGMTEAQIAAAIDQHSDADLLAGLRGQMFSDGGADRITLPLKHQDVDRAGRLLDHTFQRGKRLGAVDIELHMRRLEFAFVGWKGSSIWQSIRGSLALHYGSERLSERQDHSLLESPLAYSDDVRGGDRNYFSDCLYRPVDKRRGRVTSQLAGERSAAR